MSELNGENGFTVVEVVTTLVIMGLFLAFLFQTFFVGQSQQLVMARLSAANDLAQSNLRKITDASQVKPKNNPNPNTPFTDLCTSVSDLTQNPSATDADGIDIVFTAETTLPSSLPSSTTQNMKVQYPQGCAAVCLPKSPVECKPTMPVKIISIVTYGSETVTRISYVTTLPF